MTVARDVPHPAPTVARGAQATALATSLRAGRDSAIARWARGRLPVEWMLLAAAASGWAGLIVMWAASGSGAVVASSDVHAHGEAPAELGATSGWASPAAGEGYAEGFGAASVAASVVVMWMPMVAAMMLPTVLPAVRYVVLMSRPALRWRLAVGFVIGYVLVWVALGVALDVVLAVVGAPVSGLGLSRPVLLGAVVVASAWELTRWKQWALGRCCRTVPIRLRGWPAYRSALGFGVRNGGTCLAACGPAMVVLALAGHPIVATVVVAGFLIAEKVLRTGARLRAWAAAAGILLAAGSLFVA